MAERSALKRLILSAMPMAWVLTRNRRMSDCVALTFDDGPHPVNTPRVLDILKSRDAKATFFLVGESMERHPDICKRIAAEGHDIGGHGQTHRMLKGAPTAVIRGEIEASLEAVRRCAGVDTRLFRPPYGKFGANLLFYAARNRITTVLWSMDPEDWLQTRRPDEMLVDMGRDLRGGDIVLLHDVMDATVEMLPSLIEAFRKRGMRFVRASEMTGA